ncbi:uncharacterized protein TNCV_4036921 [Trichonephila clavipes]|nr:uncharacterized protein TNCV_4036921 [Trichonephila clavipes]
MEVSGHALFPPTSLSRQDVIIANNLKALLEGINALKNIIGNVEKRQEELRNILEKKTEQVEERYERVAGNFSLISQRVEDFKKKILACGNATNESKFVPVAPVSVPASSVSVKLSTYDGQTNWEVYKIQLGIISEANQWPEAVKACQLVASLTGEDAEVLQTLTDTELLNLNSLYNALDLRFGQKFSRLCPPADENKTSETRRKFAGVCL